MAKPKHKFGIATDAAGLVAGISIQSYNEDESIEEHVIRGADGKVIEKIAYSKTTTITVTGVLQDVQSGGFALAAGGKLKIGEVDHMIKSVSKPKSATAPNEVTITAESSDECLVTEYAKAIAG